MENYPFLMKETVKLTESTENINFNKYLNWSNKFVQQIQFDVNINKSEVPLTFYPIAKNIRTPSSYMAINILNNRSSYIDNLSRNGEDHFWKLEKNRGDWYPWLWARDRIAETNYKNIDGWKYYFNSFTNNHEPIWNGCDGDEPPPNLKLFFIYLSCIKYTFQLNENYKLLMNKYKTAMNWPDNKNILAVQIRRGESCSADGKKYDRPYFTLQQYIEKIDLMLLTNNFEYIYISTDSDVEIELIKNIRPQWKLLFLPIDRTLFFRMNNNTQPTPSGFTGTATDLEDSCRLYPRTIPFIVDSGLSDLFFISLCQGYISTISIGEFSRCGWYLQLATQEKMLPYINMNEENIDMNKRDTLLLL